MTGMCGRCKDGKKAIALGNEKGEVEKGKMNQCWRKKKVRILVFCMAFFWGLCWFEAAETGLVQAAVCGACNGQGYTMTREQNRIRRYGCTRCGGQGYQIIHPETLAVLSNNGYKKGSGVVTSHSGGGSGNPTMLNGWVQQNGFWYFYIDNVAQTGWQAIDGPWYYFNAAGQMQTGWVWDGHYYYYMADSGIMLAGQWIQSDGNWYYLTDSGAMLTGWGYINGFYYYCREPSGEMLTGWQQINGLWYYMDAGGAMQHGWQSIAGNWYYLGPANDGAMRVGWHEINGNYYFFYGDGVMAADAWVDGYYLDQDGIRRNAYTVAYHGNGGSGSVPSQSVVYNQPFAINGNLFSRTGYHFKEWNGSDGGTYLPGQTVKSLTTVQNGVVTLYARWEPDTYTVSFHANGGAVGTGSKNVVFGSAYGELPAPVRTGYTFLGWYTAANGGGKVTAETVMTTAGGHTLYAQWKINDYQVTYHANGGSSVSKPSAMVTYQKAIDLNITAVKDGYIFIGWNTDAAAKAGLASLNMPAGNVTLYAIYSIPVSDVREVSLLSWAVGNKGDYRGRSLTRTGSNMRGYSYRLDKTNLAGDFPGRVLGWALVAWDNAGNYRVLKETETAPVPQRYVQTVCHYRYEAHLGEWIKFASVSEQKVKGEAYTPAYMTPPEGYGKDHIDGSYIVEGDRESGAYYTPVSYTLYFDANGGECKTGSKPVVYGEAYGELPTASRLGYRFQGWFTEPNGGKRTAGSDRYLVPEDSTLYAHWEVNLHQVVYDYRTNGGTAAEIESVAAAFGSPVDMSVSAVKEGWEHVGWNTDPDAEEGLLACRMEDEDVVLYAVYKKEIRVTYTDWEEAGEPRNEMISIYNRAEGGTIQIPKLHGREGWQEEGWSLETQGNAPIDAAPGMELFLKEDTGFYGRYSREILVNYDTNGSAEKRQAEKGVRHYNGSGAYIDPVFTLAAAPKLENHSFAGWEKENTENEEDASGDGRKIFTAGEQVFLSQDALFKAKWDRFPELEAYDRYFTLEQAQSGEITPEVLLEKVRGSDWEDGPLKNGEDVTVLHYQPEEFAGFTADGSLSVTYQATDSFGNQTRKQITAHIVDTSLKENPLKEYTRFISSEFYKNGETYVAAEGGGLEEESVWKMQENFRAALEYALSNRKQKESIVEAVFAGKKYKIAKPGSGEWAHRKETWNFTREQTDAVQEFVTENGFGNYKKKTGISEFYEKFGECRKKK